MASRLRIVRQQDRYGIVIVLLVLSIGAQAVLTGRPAGDLVAIVLQGAALLFILHTSGVRTMTMTLASVFVGLGIVLTLLFMATGRATDNSHILTMVAGLMVLLAPVAIVRRLVQHPAITGQTVLGALAVYLLLGLFYAFLYRTVAGFLSHPFFAQLDDPSVTDFLYFSFVTQATVGYGDLTPIGGLSRMLAASEGLAGQLYLVTVVALLVSNLGQQRGTLRRAQREEEQVREREAEK